MIGPVVQYRILGPLEVVCGGQRVPIGGPRSQVVLATLLLDAGRVVPVDRLAVAVWQHRPPATVRNQVALCISGLRRSLTAAGIDDPIETARPGYAIRLRPDELDVQVARDLLARARSLQATGHRIESVQVLRSALAQWRGPALHGIHSPEVAGGARALDELFHTAREQRFDLELALGGHADIVEELVAAVDGQPLREQLRAQLMLALFRSGRQAESLRVYREFRELLVDELGVEPGQRLRTVHDAVLRGETDQIDPAPATDVELHGRPDPAAVRVPVPMQVPPPVGGFVGRHRELAELTATLQPRSANAPIPICVLTGLPGVGKSALARQWSCEYRDRFPDGQLFAELVRAGAPGEMIARPAAEVLAELLGSLGVPAWAVPVDQHSRIGLWRSLTADRRLLVVLDAGVEVDQVRPLLPGAGTSCVLVTTSRSLIGLAAIDGARMVRLQVLPTTDAVAVLRGGNDRVLESPAAVELDGQVLSSICDWCGHLPLALRIASTRLLDTQRSSRRLLQRLGDERTRLAELEAGDVSVRAALAEAYRLLSAPAQAALRGLVTLPSPDFDIPVAADVLGSLEEQADLLVEQLVDAQLVEALDHTETAGTYTINALVRLYVRELIAEGRTEAVG